MAKLVSITLSSVLDLMIENRLKPGVQSGPHSKDIINYIFKVLSDYSIKINHQ